MAPSGMQIDHQVIVMRVGYRDNESIVKPLVSSL
jgi:hypothetical protein